MLDLDPTRPPPAPKDASTLLLVRDGEAGLEVLCIERHAKSGFLGGAIVFPGGKVDPSDRHVSWSKLSSSPWPIQGASWGEDIDVRAFAIAAIRETFEEAGILVASSVDSNHQLDGERRALAEGTVAFHEIIENLRAHVEVSALRPFARWVTPEAESRRFDTRFFIAKSPDGQHASHDNHEATNNFWATPQALLRRFATGAIKLAPPTHRCLELLRDVATVTEAFALAERACLLPICPVLIVQSAGPSEHGSTSALVLPGDPAHPIPQCRVPGSTRFVLRGDQWLPESAPT